MKGTVIRKFKPNNQRLYNVNNLNAVKNDFRDFDNISISANHNQYVIVAYGMNTGFIYDIGSPDMLASIDKGLKEYYNSIKILVARNDEVNNIFNDIYKGKNKLVKSNPYMIDPIPDEYGIDGIELKNDKILNLDILNNVNQPTSGRRTYLGLLDAMNSATKQALSLNRGNVYTSKELNRSSEVGWIKQVISRQASGCPMINLGNFFTPVEPICIKKLVFKTDIANNSEAYKRISEMRKIQTSILYDMRIYIPLKLNGFINYKINKTRSNSPVVINK